MANEVELYDTTLRDGCQREGLTLSLEDKLKIAQRLDQLGIHYIEGGYPGSNPRDQEFFARARAMTWQHATITAFGSTRYKANRAEDDPNLQALLDTEAAVCTLVCKNSERHVRHVLGTTLDENLAMIADSIRFLRAHGRRVSTTRSTSSTAGGRMRCMREPASARQPRRVRNASCYATRMAACSPTTSLR